MKRQVWIAAALAATLLVSAQAQAGRTFWTLDFSNTGLHYVVNCGKVYAYTTYTVTNKTGCAQTFRPIFRVETDTKQVTFAMPAPDLAQAIRAKHGKNFLDINQISGAIADGDTKLGVAVFGGLDPAADHVKVYITGFTDAFRYQDEDNRNGFQRMMWKVYWYRPGDATNRMGSPVETKTNEWIWRSTGVAGTAAEAVTEAPVRAPAEAPEKPASAEKPAAPAEEKAAPAEEKAAPAEEKAAPAEEEKPEPAEEKPAE